MIPLGDNGTFRFFLFVIAAKPLNQQILAFFSILLVSRLRLTCSVCDGTLETSYWKCREWVLRVCKLVNIQNFIYNGHFGAKNHCCAVNHCHTKKTQNSKFLLTKTTFRPAGLKLVCIQVDKNGVERILKNIDSSGR